MTADLCSIGASNRSLPSDIELTEDVNVYDGSADECEGSPSVRQLSNESSEESTDTSEDDDASSDSDNEEARPGLNNPSKVKRYINGDGEWNESSSEEETSEEEDGVDGDVENYLPVTDGSKSRRGSAKDSIVYAPRTVDGVLLKLTEITDSDGEPKADKPKMSDIIDDILSDDMASKPLSGSNQRRKLSKPKEEESISGSSDDTDSSETDSDESDSEKDSDLERAIDDILESEVES